MLLGRYCTEDVNECLAADVCKNGGTCLNEFGGHICICLNGWTDSDCSINIDDCASQPCYNGATCHDLVAKFHCECPRGKIGKLTLSLSLFILLLLEQVLDILMDILFWEMAEVVSPCLPRGL